MVTLIINGIDLSEYVYQRKHKINHVVEHGNTEWDDGWYIKHRGFTRSRVKGSTYLTFIGKEAYDNFLDAMSLIDMEAYHNVTVYVNSLNDDKTIQAYLSYTTVDAWKTEAFGGDVAAFGVVLNIEER